MIVRRFLRAMLWSVVVVALVFGLSTPVAATPESEPSQEKGEPGQSGDGQGGQQRSTDDSNPSRTPTSGGGSFTLDAEFIGRELGNGAPGLAMLRSTFSFLSPARCGDQLHNIHASSHRPGRMNVEYRVTCKLGSAEKLHGEVQLWEDRFWGWDRIGVAGNSTKRNARKLSVYANDVCRNNHIEATASGYSEERVYDFGLSILMRFSGPERFTYAYNPCNL